jgi:hypothetical protein
LIRQSSTLLALGDTAAFVAFGIIGLISHEKSFDVSPVVRSIVPFAIAWILIAPFLGAFSEEAIRGRKPLGEIALVWLPTGVVALAVRALIFDRELFSAFFVIALIGHGLFLLSWRVVYSRWLAQAPTRV